MPEHSNRWPEALREAESTLAAYRRVFQLHAEGFAIEPIGDRTGTGRDAIKNWLSGGLPLDIERLIRLSEPVSARAHFSVLRDHSVPWAIFLGAYQGMTSRHCAEHNFVLHFENVDAALDVSTILTSFGLKAPVTESPGNSLRGTWFNVEVTSRAVCAALANVTSHNTAIPWQYLGSVEEKIAFLQAFLVTRGTMQHNRFCISSAHHPGLIVGVAALLEHLGIPSEVHQKKALTYLRVSGPYALHRLRDLKLVPERHRLEVDTLLQGVDPGFPPCQKYDEFMKLRREVPGLIVRDVAARCGISEGTAQNWMLRRGVKPIAVVARDRLMELIETFGVPHQDVVPFLCRNTELTPDECTRIGQKYPLARVERALAALLAQDPLGKRVTEQAVLEAIDSAS